MLSGDGVLSGEAPPVSRRALAVSGGVRSMLRFLTLVSGRSRRLSVAARGAPPPREWRNSSVCKNAVATGSPCRRAGAYRNWATPFTAAESSGGNPLDSATRVDSGTSWPVESANRRNTTSPSTRWSYKSGGYCTAGSAFKATGGSSAGAAAEFEGAAEPPQAVATRAIAAARRITCSPEVAVASRRGGSGPRAAKAR